MTPEETTRDKVFAILRNELFPDRATELTGKIMAFVATYAAAQRQEGVKEQQKKAEPYLCDWEGGPIRCREERDWSSAQLAAAQREIAAGFKVDVVDVTGDSAMMAENGRLKAQLAAAQLHVTGLLEQREAMEADHELERASCEAAREQATRKYGVHLVDCESHHSEPGARVPCTCGLATLTPGAAAPNA